MKSKAMNWATIVEFVIGGGFVSILSVLATMKSARRKAKAEAESIALENSKKAMETQVTFIIEPLQKEIIALRKEVSALRKAIGKIGRCALKDNCPVIDELNVKEKQKNEA
jgi:hypothetical protein